MFTSNLRRDLARSYVGLACLYLSYVPHLLRMSDAAHGDVSLYFKNMEMLLDGAIPYHQERTFEYPPYAFFVFLVPGLGSTLGEFRLLFNVQLIALDLVFKWWLLHEGLKRTDEWKGILPLLAYSIGTSSFSFFYFQRLDLVPSLMMFLSILVFSQKRTFSSGILLGVGAGMKVFPILLFPVLAAAASSMRLRWRFFLGTFASILPIIVITPWVHWWRFLEFHDRRGFEVESLYAALFWFAGFFLELDLSWTKVIDWREVTGTSVAWAIPAAKTLCLATTLASVGRIGWLTRRSRGVEGGVPEACAMGLGVLLPFVAFNIVISPQYMIWLLVMTCGALLGYSNATNATNATNRHPNRQAMIAYSGVVFACTLSPIWYPSPEFRTGFNLFQTCMLIVRNFLLIGAWLLVLVSLSQRRP